jgi:nicotinate-nucleotide adenylyltransferase
MHNERIAIIGGTFDPIHNGHLALAHAAIEIFDCNKCLLLPSAHPYHREQPISSYVERCEMLQLAIQNEKQIEVVNTSSFEDKFTYTYNSLCYIKTLYPSAELIFALGTDAAQFLDSWYMAPELIELAKLAVFNRPGYSDLFKTTSLSQLSSSRHFFYKN